MQMALMQVQLHSMYEAYFAADPSNRTPPIPTNNLVLSHSPERQPELCNLAEITVVEREAAKTALLDAILDLEHTIAPEHPVRDMVKGGKSSWMGNYIIKREYSQLSHHVFGLKVPELNPVAASAVTTALQSNSNAADTAWHVPAGGSGDQPQASSSEWNSTEGQALNKSPQQPSFLLSHSKAALRGLTQLVLSLCRIGRSSISKAGINFGAAAELQPLTCSTFLYQSRLCSTGNDSHHQYQQC